MKSSGLLKEKQPEPLRGRTRFFVRTSNFGILDMIWQRQMAGPVSPFDVTTAARLVEGSRKTPLIGGVFIFFFK